LKRHLIIAFAFAAIATNAQLVEVLVNRTQASVTKKNTSSGRTQSLEPMTLPFWDDFSFTQTEGYTNDTLWSAGKSVWVNNGIGINPPSIFSVSFDGLDSLGKPYNLTDVLGKGFADKLVSRPIKLNELPASQDDSVYLSFFYQVTGRREAPDLDDNLSLWFKTANGIWEKVFDVGNSVALDPAIFYYHIVKVDKKFFHDKFQFRFQNFARLSGPYDTWNLDYIYLNKRRTATDIYFHDQTLTKPLTSIFKNYRAIPLKHFKDTASTLLISPKVGFYNLYKFEAQSFKYTSAATIVERTGGIEKPANSFIIELDGDAQTILPKFTHLELELNETVPLDSLNLTADSIYIDFKLGFDSGDKNIVPETPFFEPIDFTLNDTIHSEFLLHKHYAYDDGSAEYGAGLNQPGGKLAYGFDLFTKEADTIQYVDIYFPEFGDNTSQTVILKFWKSVAGVPAAEIYRQTISVGRTQDNKFTRYQLVEPVGVKGRFFIGWEQTASLIVPVGLDKNTNSGDQIYFNITGNWEQNQNVTGSLMIRPVIGRGKASVINGIEKAERFSIFPNPNNGEFYLPLKATHISIYNVLGVPISFSVDQATENQRVTVNANGVLIVKWAINGKYYSTRALVRN
jgi:hypothetical protein